MLRPRLAPLVLPLVLACGQTPVESLECPAGTFEQNGLCVGERPPEPELPPVETPGEFVLRPLELRFGEIVLGTQERLRIEIYNPGPEGRTINVRPARPSAFEVSPQGELRVGADEWLFVDVTYAPLTAEEVRNILRIDTCGAGCTYYVLLQGIGLTRFDPGSFECAARDLGATDVGTCRRGFVTCRNDGGRVRRLVDLEFQPADQGFRPNFDYEIVFGFGQVRSVPVEFCPTRPGPARADFVMRIDNGDSIRATLTARGR